MEAKGTVALVTGGASGLGEATARRLVESGGKVVIVDRNGVRGEALAGELGSAAEFVAADVSDPAQVQAAIDQAISMGPFRISVSCAGVGWPSRTVSREGEPHELDLFKKIVEINLIGTFNVMRLAAAAMVQNEPAQDDERGVIINTASIAAFEGQIGQVAYSATKGAVVAMTVPAARDLSRVGIRVCAIAPGTFDTPMLHGLPDAAREALGAGIPYPRRLGDPREFARLVEHIAENRYLNGEVIRIDGALRMPPK